MSRFDSEQWSLEDDPRSGAPVTATCENNVERVHQLLDDDRRLTFDELEASTWYSLFVSLDHLEKLGGQFWERFSVYNKLPSVRPGGSPCLLLLARVHTAKISMTNQGTQMATASSPTELSRSCSQ